MRHRKKFNHLGRKTGHRKAMLANMASSLILHKRISTTTAKAKALRSYVEPLITKTKNLTTQAESSNAQRVVFSYLQNKYAVKELFKEVGPKISDRPGGYTRILKIGTRLGDSADMCIIELVDYNENLLAAKEEATKSTRRRRRGGKKSGSSQPESKVKESTTTVKKEEVKQDVEVTEEVKEDVTVDTAEQIEETPETKDEVSSEVQEPEVKTVEESPEVKPEDVSPETKSEETDNTEEEKKD